VAGLPLTKAELEVARLFVTGKKYAQIAAARNVSVDTIKTQIASLLSKTSKNNRFDLIILVVAMNLQQNGSLNQYS